MTRTNSIPLRCRPLKAAVSLLVVLLVHPSALVDAIVSYEGHKFDSMPAHFGMLWSPAERTYQARLQFLEDNPRLCDTGFGDDSIEGLVMSKDSLPGEETVDCAESGSHAFSA
jgi:hypothetical protein